MSLISKILDHSRNARVPRARDPETHKPIPYGTNASAAVRLGAWMVNTSWGKRFLLKWIAAFSVALTAWLMGHGGGEHTPIIVAGAVAGISFLYEQLASWLNSKATMKIPPHVGGQSFAQSLASQSPPFTSDSGQSFTRSEMFKAIIAKQSPDAQQDQRTAHGLPFSPFTLAEAVAEADPLPFEVECEGELHGFSTKTEAYIFRNQCKNEGKTAKCLF